MNVARYISSRLKFKGETGRRSPSVVIAVCGIAISVTVMLLTIAIVTGFKNQIEHKVMGFDAQIALRPIAISSDETDESQISLSPQLSDLLNSELPDYAVKSLSMSCPGVLRTDDAFNAVVLRCYPDNSALPFVAENLIDGMVPDFEDEVNRNSIVLSAMQSKKLGVGVGDKVTTFFFDEDGSGVRLRNLEVRGIYESYFAEYDDVVAYASPDLISRIKGIRPGRGEALEINDLNREEIEPLTQKLNDKLAAAYYSGDLDQYYVAQSIFRRVPAYFSWLDLLNTNVVVIMILMGCVAGFTLVSCLFILILERVKMIGLLKSIGASNGLVSHVFMLLAARLIFIGLVIGNLLSAALIFMQDKWHLIHLDPETYCLNYVPVDISLFDVCLLDVAVVTVAVLLMFVPTRLISRLSPSTTMRYE